MKTTLLLVLFCVLTCLIYGQAQAGSDSENVAVKSARTWLSLIDGGLYSGSWREASTYFRGAVSQTGWEESLIGVRKPLGKLISRKVVKTKEATELPGAPDGKYIIMIFKSSFVNKKTATETVTFMLDKNKWKAAGYFIK